MQIEDVTEVVSSSNVDIVRSSAAFGKGQSLFTLAVCFKQRPLIADFVRPKRDCREPMALVTKSRESSTLTYTCNKI